jgi:hypothetical protein
MLRPSIVSRIMRTLRIIAAALAAAAAFVSAPSPAHAATPPAETVAEAMFLCDALPPGGRDLTLSVAVSPADPGPTGAASGFAAEPRLQLAYALGDRVGFTADVGLGANGAALDAPGASLKLLLRAPAPDRTGLALSLDLYGASHAPRASEAGLGLGLVRALGPVTLRAGASVATPVTGFGPHLHAGASAALAAGARVRLLGEVVTMASGRETSWAAGPSVKVALADAASASAGVLLPFDGGAPTFTVQLAHGL